MSILRRFTLVIEQISIDEAFLDVSERYESMFEIAMAIQKSVNQETKLPCSLGIATNKLVAKIANDFGKSQYCGTRYPNALTVIEPGNEQQFLAPLPLRRLWGVGPKTADSLRKKGLEVIGDLAAKSNLQLVEWFGTSGPHLKRHAMGIDERPVESSPEKHKSISNETTFANDVNQPKILESAIERISFGLGNRLKQLHQRASVIRIKYRWEDFTTFTRQTTVTPTDDGKMIARVAVDLFRKNWNPEKAIRLVGVAVGGLVNKSDQLSLWDQEVEKNQDIFQAIAEIEDKFGREVIKTGNALQKGEE